VLSALRLGPTRRSTLLLRIAGISDKALTEALRRLLARGLVARAERPGDGAGVVVYQLSALGESFADGPLAQLALWAAEHRDELTPSPADQTTAP
jgi:DNA-binding HxlR family transcriptional regulator